MAKCEICGERIPTTFLGKLVGTTVKIPGSKKLHYVCSSCQSQHSKEDLASLLENK